MDFIYKKYKDCNPCFSHDRCCNKNNNYLFSPCMENIKPEEVLKKIIEIINKKNIKNKLKSLKIEKHFCSKCNSKDTNIINRKGNNLYWYCNTCSNVDIN